MLCPGPYTLWKQEWARTPQSPGEHRLQVLAPKLLAVTIAFVFPPIIPMNRPVRPLRTGVETLLILRRAPVNWKPVFPQPTLVHI